MVTFRHSCVILDACCLITLYESGHMNEVLKCIPSSVVMAAYVKEKEILRFDLQPLIDEGLLLVVDLESLAEQNTAVDFAAALRDNGEAFTGAIAKHRNWAIATDDRRAASFFVQTTPSLQILSTLELMKNWVDSDAPSFEIVRDALAKVRLEVPYVPSRSHPLYDWWLLYRVEDA